MNVIKKTVAILGICAYACTTSAAPDCMDNSSHLKEKIDHKELRYVQCNHDCYKDPNSRLVENRGECSVCGHYHLPRPLVIVKSTDPTTVPAQKITPNKNKNQLARLFSVRVQKKNQSLIPHEKTHLKKKL